jgi:Flp pilus assembly pilin Flp
VEYAFLLVFVAFAALAAWVQFAGKIDQLANSELWGG